MDLPSVSGDHGGSWTYQDSEGEMGLIERVSIKNLMCHSNLKFSFCPHVNYVLGRNGSGKSAVLAAIMIALGGKVNFTGRGNNIKSIIQKGKQTAEVSVTLNNTGPDAFQYDIYGDSLTVERRLTIDGGSSYKIKNSSGQTVSSKKEDLNSILQAFNIQVQNPVAILTQETSRNFLNSKDPGDKYAFFYKATQLEQLKQTYVKTTEFRKEAQFNLQAKQDALPKLYEEITQLQRKLMDHQSMEKQKEKLRELENECAWALVIEKEMIAEKHRQAVENVRRSLEEYKKKLKTKEDVYNELLRKESSIEKEKTALNNDMQVLEERRVHSSNEKNELKNKQREVKGNISKHDKNCSLLEKEIELMSNKVKTIKLRSEEDIRRKEEERIQKINIHIRKRDEYGTKIKDLECEIKEMQEAFEKIKSEQLNKVDNHRNLRFRAQASEKEIDKMRQYKRDRISAYGFEMPRLIQKINSLANQRVFHQKPLGPIGLSIRIKDPKWTLAIERCLGRRPLAFLCDNMDDADKLQEVIQEMNIQRPPPVVFSKFIRKVHDVRKNEVKSQRFCSVLDMLRDTDPVVLNHLIDDRSIENILLIENNSEARSVMMYEHEVPKKCYEAYTLSGNNVCPAPNFAFYANRNKNPTLLSINAYSDDEIELKRKELEELRKCEQQAREDCDRMNGEMMLQGKIVLQKTNALHDFEKQFSKEDTDIKVLQNCEESNNVTSLEREYKKLEKELESKRGKIMEEETLLININKNLEEVENDIIKVKERYDAKVSEMNNLLSNSLRGSENNSRSLQNEKAELEKICVETAVKLKEMIKEHREKEADAKEDIKRAESLCPRINTSRKPEVIEPLINQRKELLERNYGSECTEDIILKLNNKRREYNSIERDIKEIDNFLKKLKHVMTRRLATLKAIESHVSLRVNYMFTVNLKTQEFAAYLDFDHNKCVLDIIPHSTKHGNATSRSTKSLSGGERSFTTVALMLALWDAVEMPFRILDEYDVFMDQVNRKHSMDLMLKTALEHGRNQFIFLSPLQLSEFTHSPRIKILYMPEPRRSFSQHQGEGESAS